MKSTAILFGGSCSESLVSCSSAQNFSTILPDAKCWFWQSDGSVLDVNPSDLRAHKDPFRTPFNPTSSNRRFQTVAESLDFAKDQKYTILVSLHGGDGENGLFQKECESRLLGFTASGSTASALAMNKVKAKKQAKDRGLLTAEYLTFNVINEQTKIDLNLFLKQFKRVVLKPVSEGSSTGLAFIESQSALNDWISKNEVGRTDWLCEEMLEGREVTIGVIMHNNCLLALPPSEVILEKNARFDYAGKYLGVGNREVTPAELSPREMGLAQEAVLLAHSSLGCYGYTRSEVILTSKGPVFLETNTLPGFTNMSFIPQQLRAAKIGIEDFVQSQLELARRRYEV